MRTRWPLTARRYGNANLGHGCLTILVSDCLAGFEVECESEGTFCFVLLPPYKSVARVLTRAGAASQLRCMPLCRQQLLLDAGRHGTSASLQCSRSAARVEMANEDRVVVGFVGLG